MSTQMRDPRTAAAEQWLDAKDLAAREGVTPRAIRKRLDPLLAAQNGTRSLYVRRVASANGGGRDGKLEFNVTLLERDGLVQSRNQQIDNRHSPESHLVSLPGDSLPIERAGPPPAPPSHEIQAAPEQGALFRAPVNLPAKSADVVEQRLAILDPILEFRRRKSEGRAEMRVGGRKMMKLDDVVNFVAAQRGVGARTLYSWLRAYAKSGDHALVPAQRSDSGLSRLFGRAPERIPDDPAELERELAKLTPAGRELARLYLVAKWTAPVCHEFLKRDFARVGLPAAPSYRAVCMFLDSFPQAFHDRRHSEARFHDRNAPYAIRDFTTARVLEYWVLDHEQNDFFVRNDWIEPLDRLAFPDLPRDAKLRMWMTAFMDIRSRYILGYAFSVHPSSTAICSALRMAVLQTGRAPRFGLLDRGEDMKKMGLIKAGAPLAHAGAFARLIAAQWPAEGGKSGCIFSIGEHPQSKPIESWFRTKRERFDKLVPSYCGNKPENRPETCDALLDLHAAALAAREPDSSPLPRASQAVAATLAWIEYYNRSHEHTGHGMGRRTPEQVLRAGYPLAQQQAAVAQLDRRALDELLWDRQQRVVRNECVEMYRAQYEAADESSRAVLRAWNGRALLVGADPHNLGDAIAIHPESGERLAVLVQKQFLAWGATQDQIRARMRAQRSALKAQNNALAILGSTPPLTREPFGFLGEGFLAATGTDGTAAAAPLPRSIARTTQEKFESPFVDDAVKNFLAEEEGN